MKKTIIISLFSLLAMILLFSACGLLPAGNEADNPRNEEEPVNNQPVQPIKKDAYHASDAGRESAAAINAEPVLAQAAGSNQFAFDLYHELTAQAAEQGDIFFSPYSISSALAMAYGGAKGSTESQMADTLHFSGQESTHAAFNALNQYFDGLNRRAQENEWEDFELLVTNALWGNRDFAIQESYLDLLARYYGAGIYTLDFSNDPEQARAQINDWVAEQTREKITDLLPPGTITADTRVVLTNTIYFIASWTNQFEESLTKPADFTLLSGEVVQAPTMNITERYAYKAGEGWQMIELPYNGGAASMVIILPDSGQFEAVQAQLDAPTFAAMRAEKQFRQVDLYLPKFSSESEFSLNDMLIALGMPDAFSAANADFSGITGARDLFISAVLHKAVIEVDEKGTEAAAATAVVMEETSAMIDEEQPLELRIDRPFLYAIINPESGAILFLGQMTNPAD